MSVKKATIQPLSDIFLKMIEDYNKEFKNYENYLILGHENDEHELAGVFAKFERYKIFFAKELDIKASSYIELSIALNEVLNICYGKLKLKMANQTSFPVNDEDKNYQNEINFTNQDDNIFFSVDLIAENHLDIKEVLNIIRIFNNDLDIILRKTNYLEFEDVLLDEELEAIITSEIKNIIKLQNLNEKIARIVYKENLEVKLNTIRSNINFYLSYLASQKVISFEGSAVDIVVNSLYHDMKNIANFDALKRLEKAIKAG